jgi:transcriptional regulator with XRE-family HTH domain
VGAVERGEKNAFIDTLEKIATAFNIEILDLLALAQGRIDIDRLRARVIEEVNESPPEMLKLIAALIEMTRNAKAPASRKSRKPRKKSV